MIGDFNRSLGCYFICIVKERTSVASFARAIKSRKIFCDLNFLLKNPNRSTCLSSLKCPYKKA